MRCRVGLGKTWSLALYDPYSREPVWYLEVFARSMLRQQQQHRYIDFLDVAEARDMKPICLAFDHMTKNHHDHAVSVKQ